MSDTKKERDLIAIDSDGNAVYSDTIGQGYLWTRPDGAMVYTECDLENDPKRSKTILTQCSLWDVNPYAVIEECLARGNISIECMLSPTATGDGRTLVSNEKTDMVISVAHDLCSIAEIRYRNRWRTICRYLADADYDVLSDWTLDRACKGTHLDGGKLPELLPKLVTGELVVGVRTLSASRLITQKNHKLDNGIYVYSPSSLEMILGWLDQITFNRSSISGT